MKLRHERAIHFNFDIGAAFRPVILASFSGFLLAFLGIGLASYLRSTKTPEDYYLASRHVPAWLAGLSAVATNNSGYMFIGVIGYTYTVGLVAVWLMVGWIAGDLLASQFIHRRLNMATQRTGEVSFNGVLARWNGGDMPVWRRVAAIFTILFLGAYAAAQISAGGKALHGVLGWDQTVGAWLVALMVLAYCIAGGIRASIWTDAAQATVMMAAMLLLFLVGVHNLGGLFATVETLADIPGYLDLTPPNLLVPAAPGLLLFILGWMFAGVSVIGQPHIMVRFMAVHDPRGIKVARIWYYAYFTVFYALATGVGMLSRHYLPELQNMDPELALPTIAVQLLHPALVGVILAGIFAATMSTADSLVLSCSAAITNDLVPSMANNPVLIKTATALITGFALIIALSNSSSVFSLVILSWSTLACAFGPLLILYALQRKITEPAAIAIMLAGIAVALAWRQLGWHENIYEGMPGILVGAALGLLLSKSRQAAMTASPIPHE